MANITLKYNDSTIAELNSLGSLLIKTGGHACEFDIRLDYINYCPRTSGTSFYNIQTFYDSFEPYSVIEEITEV